MKTPNVILTTSLSILLFACDSTITDQTAQKMERGKEVEAQAQMRDQSSILADETFAELVAFPDKYSFEEADAHYRKHWAIQEGVAMNHNDHNIALFMIDHAYDISSQPINVIRYYVNEMNALDFLSLSTIPIFKEAVQALEPSIGSAAANQLLQDASRKNEKAAERYKEINPAFSAQLLEAQVQLVR